MPWADMARQKKKSPATGSGPSTSAHASAPQLQKDVERLDRELIKLINERVKTAHRAIRQGGGEAGAVGVRPGDQEYLDRLLEVNKGPFGAGSLRVIFREIFSGTRELLRPSRVVYLGPEFSYSHLAAVEQFGHGAELVPVATIAAVFDALNRRQADFGLVPIENSTDGRVTDTLDMFARLPVRICGEVQLRIHHYLLGKVPAQ